MTEDVPEVYLSKASMPEILMELARRQTGAGTQLFVDTTHPLSEEAKAAFAYDYTEYQEQCNLPPLAGPCPIAAYQEACNLTEALPEGEALVRWQTGWKVALSRLSRMCSTAERTGLDVLKKYMAYGKIPKYLDFGEDSGHSSGNRPDAYGQPEKENEQTLYRVLHALLGIHTEVEELTVGILNALVDYEGGEAELHKLDKVNIAEEIGDLEWYVGLMCNALGLSLKQILETNHDKLMLRYRTKQKEKGQAVADALGLTEAEQAFGIGFAKEPELTEEAKATLAEKWNKLFVGTTSSVEILPDGVSFSPEAAINRDLDAERKLLEDPFYVDPSPPQAAPLMTEALGMADVSDLPEAPVCPHPSIKIGRSGQRICAVCNAEVPPETKPKAFGF